MLTTPIFSDAHHRMISLTLLLTFVLAAATPVFADEVTASQATATEDSATEDTNAAVAAEQTTATATDDTDGATNPGASEVCDEADNDCDATVDEE